MKPRQILIVVAVAVAAFAAAFAIAGGSRGGESKADAPAASSAEEIDVGKATVSSGVSAATGLPALNVPKPKPKPKDEPDETTPGGPTGGSAQPPADTATPPSNPPPSDSPPSDPPPSDPPPAGNDEPPVIGGGVD